jgi:hypothetical protein
LNRKTRKNDKAKEDKKRRTTERQAISDLYDEPGTYVFVSRTASEEGKTGGSSGPSKLKSNVSSCLQAVERPVKKRDTHRAPSR